ncbi:MAG: amidohydrolase family protein [Acidimicrobiia bacterium]|nr:amidohydrolase family protein [Acidimicrobiia bacterium]
MTHDHHRSAAEVRARIDHPIIDADGHWLEYHPTIVEALERIGGPIAAEGFQLFPRRVGRALSMTPEQRRHRGVAQEIFWAYATANARDRATALIPAFLYERLDELGIDFSVLYPTHGLALPALPDAEMRRATCRAFNEYLVEHFGDYADRMTPAAVIPMFDPDEAIAELEHVRSLGLKAIVVGSLMRRPIPDVIERSPEAGRRAVWNDTLGVDSLYDYDPVWDACRSLGFSPTFHMGARGFGMRMSPTNFVYNHIGHFATASEAVCKSLFLDGVTRRFPEVNFGFLEGGVAWAVNLFSDLIGHWEKRNLEALEHTRPENLDLDTLVELAERYGEAGLADRFRRREGLVDYESSTLTGGLSELDDYARCEISAAEDFVELFTRSFYFGCEADDRMNSMAFNTAANPFGARVKTLYGSDIGHFDVIDMNDVVPEAYELVDEGLMSDGDFQDFVFGYPVSFFGGTNPAFFAGTRVEAAVSAELTAVGV